MKMKEIEDEYTEEEDIYATPTIAEQNREMKTLRKYIKQYCKKYNVPFFFAFYTTRFHYAATIPEEIDVPEQKKNYGKFDGFLRVCLNANRHDSVNPVISPDKK